MGSGYHGWQIQKNAESVQEVITQCLSTLLNAKVEIVGSGRTDTGVHAIGQIFHADIDEIGSTHLFQDRLNSFLPQDISIHRIQAVKPEVHARFDAVGRQYKYVIARRKDPLLYGRAYRYTQKLDLIKMNQGAQKLLGEHDFQCFSRVKSDVNHFLCKVKGAEWSREGNSLVFTISANRFLRGMVRAIVGTLLQLGMGTMDLKGLTEILQSHDRQKAGPSVPSDGLYLVSVNYPKSIYL